MKSVKLLINGKKIKFYKKENIDREFIYNNNKDISIYRDSDLWKAIFYTQTRNASKYHAYAYCEYYSYGDTKQKALNSLVANLRSLLDCINCSLNNKIT